MRFHLPQCSLQLVPNEMSRLQQLVQAHYTPQALARRAQLILTTHAYPHWNSKQMARMLDRKERWVRKWRRR